jgi:ubiquinone/menaquinone biosynthesis C-methylase UbiE
VKFLTPEAALREFGIYGTLDVGDFGSGAGHFSLAAAKRLEGGRLFAIDIEKDMLGRLVSDARERGLVNVHPIWGDIATHRGVPLADASLDRALLTNILSLVHDRDATIREMKRLLRPGGKALVIDWHDESEGGPHRHHKINRETAESLLLRHGFTKQTDIEAGDHHYGIIVSI